MYFLQDDFFILLTSQAASLKGVLSFLVPRTDSTNFRPICLQGYYFLFNRLFGLNPLPYHIVQIVFHAACAILVYLLTKRLLKKTAVAFLAALLFVVSWTHFYDLSWIVCTCNQISLTFILLYLLTGITKRKYLSPVFLLLSLLSVEAAVAAPALLLLIQIFFTKKSLKENFFSLSLHFLMIIFYMVYRFVIFKIPAGGTYTIEFLPVKMAKNVVVFILWLFNFPEALTTHFKIRLYPFVFADSWFAETFPVFSVFISISLLLYFVTCTGIIWQNRKSIFNKFTLFCMLWFFVGLTPLLMIPNRTYPYYTFIAQVGFWMMLAKILTDNFKYLLVKIALIVFIIANFVTLNFENENHWLFSESFQVKNYFSAFRELKLNPKWKYLYWEISDAQARQALSFGQGLNAISGCYDMTFYLQKPEIPPPLRKKTIDFNEELAKQRYLEYLKKHPPANTPEAEKNQ